MEIVQEGTAIAMAKGRSEKRTEDLKARRDHTGSGLTSGSGVKGNATAEKAVVAAEEVGKRVYETYSVDLGMQGSWSIPRTKISEEGVAD